LRCQQTGRGGLLNFVRYFWPALEPKMRPLIEGWPKGVILLHAMPRSTPRRPAVAWVAEDRGWEATDGCAQRVQTATICSPWFRSWRSTVTGTPSTVVSNGIAKFSSIIVNQPVNRRPMIRPQDGQMLQAYWNARTTTLVF
jgi:hypothetical protein